MRHVRILLAPVTFALIPTLALTIASLSSAQAPPQPLPEVSALIKEGQTIEAARFADAIALYEKALALAVERKHALSEALALLRLGDSLDSNDPQRALPMLERAYVLFGQLGIWQRQADCLKVSGNAAISMSNYSKAGEYYSMLDKLARERNDTLLIVNALSGLATVDREKGQGNAAIEKYREAIELLRSVPNSSRSTAILMNNLGGAYADLGDFHRAKETFEESRRIARDANEQIAESLALANLGNVLTRLGETQRALECLQQALPLQPNNLSFQAYCYHQMAILYDVLGDLLKFFEFAQKGLAIKTRIGDARSIAISYADISNFYETVGQPDQAEECLKQAWKWMEGTDYAFGKVQVLCKTGDFYIRNGRPDQVPPRLEKAVELAKGIDGSRAVMEVEALRGDYLRATGKLAEARPVLEKTLALTVQHDEPRRRIEVLANLGSLESSLKRYSESRARLEEALIHAKQAEYLEGEVDVLSRLGALDEQENRPREASKRYARALELIERSRESLGAMSEGKLGYLNALSHLYQRHIALLLDDKRTELAYEWTQKAKARALLDLMAAGRVNIAQAMTPEDRQKEEGLRLRGKELTQKWLSAEGESNSLKRQDKRSAEQAKRAEERLNGIKTQQQELEREWRAFHDELYTRNPRLAHQRGARVATIDQIASVLPADAALLEYAYIAPRPGGTEKEEFVLFVVTRERGRPKLAHFRFKSAEPSIATLAADLRRACSARPGTSAERPYQNLSRQLYDLLVQPATRVIQGKKRLIVCPDGPLWDVPFQALIGPAGQSGARTSEHKFLWQRFDIAYGYSATGTKAATEVGARPNRPRSQRTMLVMANPDFGTSTARTRGSAESIEPASLSPDGSEAFDRSGLGDLPHTAVEANEIAAVYPNTTIKTRAEAQESIVKSQADGFRLLHFATHALVNDAAPMLTGVVLSRPPKGSNEDGILTVRELFGMNLSADMIVFSACDTARGARKQGEGLIGLTWAAFAAGVPTQVVSQWSVDDRATAILMGRFYRELRNGKAKDSALRAAALSMLRDAGHEHPFYWAPFLVVGDWR